MLTIRQQILCTEQYVSISSYKMQLYVRDTRHNQRFRNNNCISEVVHILPQTIVSITQMVHSIEITSITDTIHKVLSIQSTTLD